MCALHEGGVARGSLKANTHMFCHCLLISCNVRTGVRAQTSKALASLSSLSGLLDEVERKGLEAKGKAGNKNQHKFGEAVKSSKARAAIT